MTPPSFFARKLLLLASAIVAVVAIVSYFVIDHTTDTRNPTNSQTATPATSNTADTPHTAKPPNQSRPTAKANSPTPPTAAVTPAAPPAPAISLARTPEGRIDPASVREFTPIAFPGGKPAYDGEPVTAYIAVPSSGRKVALTVNQLGEFPRIDTAPSEKVEVRLAFSTTQPATPVAIVAQDGGKLHTGKLSAALPIDDERQLAFAFNVSSNIGNHRVTVTTPSGEVKTLEFWAGPPPVLMQAAK